MKISKIFSNFEKFNLQVSWVYENGVYTGVTVYVTTMNYRINSKSESLERSNPQIATWNHFCHIHLLNVQNSSHSWPRPYSAFLSYWVLLTMISCESNMFYRQLPYSRWCLVLRCRWFLTKIMVRIKYSQKSNLVTCSIFHFSAECNQIPKCN